MKEFFLQDIKINEIKGITNNALPSNTVQFSGYASIFNIVDKGMDVVCNGAFNDTIESNKDTVLTLLWQHDVSSPIGKITSIYEDETGLFVIGEIFTNIIKGQEAIELIKKGVISGMSIGYVPVDFHYNEHEGIRYIYNVELIEISVVTFPLNEATTIELTDNENYADDNNSMQEFMSSIQFAVDSARVDHALALVCSKLTQS